MCDKAIPEIPDLELRPAVSGEHFARLIQYSVIVECWRKKENGSSKRRWLGEFTEAERKEITWWHDKRFVAWHLRTGTPLRISMRLSSIPLLQRACNFFASL